MTRSRDERAGWIVQQVLKAWPTERLAAAIADRRPLHHEIGVGLIFPDPSDPDTAHIPAGHAEAYVPGPGGACEAAIVPVSGLIARLGDREASPTMR